MGLVGLVGFVEVDFFRLWVGHGETPRCDRVCYLCEMSTLLVY
jgi:hypothetical protein